MVNQTWKNGFMVNKAGFNAAGDIISAASVGLTAKTTCKNACKETIKTKIAAVNTEIKAAQAVKKTEVDASNAKFKTARAASLAKIAATDVSDCNAKCKGTTTTTDTTTTDTTTTTTTPACTETVESSGAITEKCCTNNVCTSKVIAKDSDTCDCDEKYKYAINDAIARGAPNSEQAALRARQAACYNKCKVIY
jgi:hypothetical protein